MMITMMLKGRNGNCAREMDPLNLLERNLTRREKCAVNLTEMPSFPAESLACSNMENDNDKTTCKITLTL